MEVSVSVYLGRFATRSVNARCDHQNLSLAAEPRHLFTQLGQLSSPLPLPSNKTRLQVQGVRNTVA